MKGSPEHNLIEEAKALQVEEGHMPGQTEKRKEDSGSATGEGRRKPPDSREGRDTRKGKDKEQGPRGEIKVFTSGPNRKGNREPRARLFPRD